MQRKWPRNPPTSLKIRASQDKEQNMFKKIFSGFFFSVLSVVLICVLFASIMLNVVLLGVTSMQGQQKSSDNSQHFSEKIIEGKNKKSKILIVEITGVISDSGPDSYCVKSEYVKQIFTQAQRDKNIQGIILHINSPGGTIMATDKIFRIIEKYKSATKVPVLAYFDGVAASGGYYIAMACDKVMSHATTITGSIGVIMSFYQAQELLQNKLGIDSVVIKTGKHKDMGSMSRKVTEQELEIFNGILQEMYQAFLDKVRQGRSELRNMSQQELEVIADGRIYTGKQAFDLKLVDELGYLEDAQQQICQLAGTAPKEVSFVKYEKKGQCVLGFAQTTIVCGNNNQ